MPKSAMFFMFSPSWRHLASHLDRARQAIALVRMSNGAHLAWSFHEALSTVQRPRHP